MNGCKQKEILRVLIDTNVAYTFISERDDSFSTETFRIMHLCVEGDIQGYLAFHSLSTIWYICRKFDDSKRRRMLMRLCNIITVVGASHSQIINAIQRSEFKDFEDCLQDKCAKEANCDYIVTANVKDFKHSEIPAVDPYELLRIISD